MSDIQGSECFLIDLLKIKLVIMKILLKILVGIDIDFITWKTNMWRPSGTGPTKTVSSTWSYASLSADPT